VRAAAGLLIRDIENFVTISEYPVTVGPGGCEAFPFETKGFVETTLALSWDDLPNPDSELVTSTGLLDLIVENRSDASVAVDLTARLSVLGYRSVQTFTQFTVAAESSTTKTIDLNDFIPPGVDPEEIPDALLDLPTSASLAAVAVAVSGGQSVDTAAAPRVFGHPISSTEEVVVYREQAMRDSYNNGDLENLGSITSTSSRTIKVYGSRGPLP
jgi:hypothetical protein